jgi:hypothetical protein
MIRKLKKFTALPPEEKWLFLEAYSMLGRMRAAILTLSFKRLTRSLEQSRGPGEIVSLDTEQMRVVLSVGRAIGRAAAATPWESACLVQSLTAQRMLQKRGIPGVFYLGVAKDGESDEKMKAHAWTQCGEKIITGRAGHEAFTVVSVFGSRSDAGSDEALFDYVGERGR